MKPSVTLILLLLVACSIQGLYAQGNKAADSRRVIALQKPVEEPLSDSLQYAKGKVAFHRDCRSCHSSGKELMVGPGLAGITKRQSKAQIHRWVRNSTQLILSGDPYANALYKQYQYTLMPAFPKLTDQEIQAILFFIDGNYPQKQHD